VFCIQFFDTVHWTSERAFGQKIPAPTIPKESASSDASSNVAVV